MVIRGGNFIKIGGIFRGGLLKRVVMVVAGLLTVYVHAERVPVNIIKNYGFEESGSWDFNKWRNDEDAPNFDKMIIQISTENPKTGQRHLRTDARYEAVQSDYPNEVYYYVYAYQYLFPDTGVVASNLTEISYDRYFEWVDDDFDRSWAVATDLFLKCKKNFYNKDLTVGEVGDGYAKVIIVTAKSPPFFFSPAPNVYEYLENLIDKEEEVTKRWSEFNFNIGDSIREEGLDNYYAYWFELGNGGVGGNGFEWWGQLFDVDNVRVLAYAGYDARAKEIRGIEDFVAKRTLIEPEGVFHNNGLTELTDIPVKAYLYDSEGKVIYSDSATIPSLSSEEEVEVAFKGFALNEDGDYVFEIVADIEDDSEEDNFLVKPFSVQGVEEKAGDVIIGNPVVRNGFIMFGFSGKDVPYVVEIYDLNGRKLYEHRGRTGEKQFNYNSSLPEGIYFYRITTPGVEKTGKITYVR